ncbi:MAG TPA: hypothetical protein DEB32_12590 [Stenotrophomonas sp.]|nr:hypothetical protein [Stenotrophomonas sp.]
MLICLQLAMMSRTSQTWSTLGIIETAVSKVLSLLRMTFMDAAFHRTDRCRRLGAVDRAGRFRERLEGAV